MSRAGLAGPLPTRSAPASYPHPSMILKDPSWATATAPAITPSVARGHQTRLSTSWPALPASGGPAGGAPREAARGRPALRAGWWAQASAGRRGGLSGRRSAGARWPTVFFGLPSVPLCWPGALQVARPGIPGPPARNQTAGPVPPAQACGRGSPGAAEGPVTVGGWGWGGAGSGGLPRAHLPAADLGKDGPVPLPPSMPCKSALWDR